MRFDANGVLSAADGFRGPRPPGSPAALEAAERLAEGLADAGLSVEAVAAQPAWLPRTVVGSLLMAMALPWPALPLLLWYLVAVDVLVPDYPAWVRLGLPFLMIVALGDALWYRVRRAIGEPGRAPSLHLVAHDGREIERPARLMLVTSLITPSPRWLPYLNGALVLFGVWPILKYLVSASARRFDSLPILIFDLAAPWLALLLVAHGVPVRSARPRMGDNRTGLAMLIGLAKSWPRPVRDRVGLWLIATPDAADLARVLPRPAPGVRTLAISLDAPGVGPAIEIGGRGESAAFVREVAQSLWLPAEARRTLRDDPAARRWGVPRTEIVRVGGAHDDRPIDPAVLGAIAQLIEEAARRWGKAAAPADLAQTDAAGGSSAERSSQNPG